MSRVSNGVWARGLALLVATCAFAPEAVAVTVARDPSVASVKPEATQNAAPVPSPQLPKLTAAQIAERNAQARGGLAAWRAVQTIQVSGLLDAGGRNNARLPYTLLMKRPHYQRVAIEFAGQTALQVYDGQNGWKLRPFLNRNDVELLSEEERQSVVHQSDVDGPLIDYAVKGSTLELEGTEMVEGRANYRLKLTTQDGYARRIWVDGKTFLESKIEGNPRRFDGKMRRVESYLRDYRKVNGVLFPFVSETWVEGARQTRKMTVEKVALNPPLEDHLFAKPVAPAGRVGQGAGGAAEPAAQAVAAPASSS
ncbi:MAG: outer membrane lipoprotein-sorting protein [Gammaproteobacteria bacterium]|nr:MAG: outer membrane lipoprotein-sorting protein [Gammaproteobacteria bacterium]